MLRYPRPTQGGDVRVREGIEMPWIGRLSSLWNRTKLYKHPYFKGWFSTRFCLVCGALDADCSGVCGACQADFPKRKVTQLRRKIDSVDVAFATYRYEFPITNLIRATKFHRDLAALALLQSNFIEALVAELGEIDFLVPVPLAPGRFIQRGFNQAAELARALGKANGIPVRYSLVARKAGRSLAQSKLSAVARRENIKGVYSTKAELRGARIAVVDDVITTGATCGAVAEVLRAAGAVRVIAVAVAATPYHREDGESI